MIGFGEDGVPNTEETLEALVHGTPPPEFLPAEHCHDDAPDLPGDPDCPRCDALVGLFMTLDFFSTLGAVVHAIHFMPDGSPEVVITWPSENSYQILSPKAGCKLPVQDVSYPSKAPEGLSLVSGQFGGPIAEKHHDQKGEVHKKARFGSLIGEPGTYP